MKAHNLTTNNAGRYKTTITLTHAAEAKVLLIDHELIGTLNYIGLARFWSVDYVDFFRHADPPLRVRIHDALLRAGLPLNCSSEMHEEVIEPFVPPKLNDAWQTVQDLRREQMPF
jgi:hypothetical protein